MDLTFILEFAANVIIVAGGLIFSVAAIGLFKFPDTYQRISAVGTAAGLGISLIMIGVFMLAPSWSNFVKLLVILFLQLATSSIGTMAIARSTYLTGKKMTPGYFDHLAEDQGEDEPTDDDDDAEIEDGEDDSEAMAEKIEPEEEYGDPRF